MKTFATLCVALAMLGSGVLAQVKTVPGDRVTKTGTVEAIDHQLRVLTLKDGSNSLVTVDVPASVPRFDQVKIGDRVTATYYDSVTVRVKAPGEKPVNSLGEAVTPTAGQAAGTMARQRTMTATVESLDPKVPSITFKGQNGWRYSRRIEDKTMVGKVKVGDQVDFVWTEALQLSIDPPKK